MLTIKKGNIFDSKMDVLTIPVNCVGVMGKGLALEFKNRYPVIFDAYKEDCLYDFHIGQVNYYERNFRNVNYTHDFLLFPTKKHWRESSKMEYIEKGLLSFTCHLSEWNIKSIAFPALGCGLGGLNWFDVVTLMVKKLVLLPIDMEIYEPNILPNNK